MACTPARTGGSCSAASTRPWPSSKVTCHRPIARRYASCATASMYRWTISATPPAPRSDTQPHQQHQYHAGYHQLATMAFEELLAGIAVQLLPGVVVIGHFDQPVLINE